MLLYEGAIAETEAMNMPLDVLVKRIEIANKMKKVD